MENNTDVSILEEIKTSIEAICRQYTFTFKPLRPVEVHNQFIQGIEATLEEMGIDITTLRTIDYPFINETPFPGYYLNYIIISQGLNPDDVIAVNYDAWTDHISFKLRTTAEMIQIEINGKTEVNKDEV